jgi:hypothetical protein
MARRREAMGKKVFQMFVCSVRIPYVTPDGWSGVREYPTFFLHPDVQGLRTPLQVEKFLKRSFGEGHYEIQLVDMLSGGSLVYTMP